MQLFSLIPSFLNKLLVFPGLPLLLLRLLIFFVPLFFPWSSFIQNVLGYLTAGFRSAFLKLKPLLVFPLFLRRKQIVIL